MRSNGKLAWIKLLCCVCVIGAAVCTISFKYRSLGANVTADTTADAVDSGDKNAAPPAKSSSSKGGEKYAQDADDSGCKSCHTGVEPSHVDAKGKESPVISCVYCHGGNGVVKLPDGAAKDSFAYDKAKNEAHVLPKYPEAWKNKKTGKLSSANPVQSATLLNKEDPKFIRFVNPGDFRVSDITCGECHEDEVKFARTSMMAHGGFLWGAALYNNGAWRVKNTQWGEAYNIDGAPVRLETKPAPTAEETKYKGVVPFLNPLVRWEVSQPGNILRVFERGGEPVPEVGNPLPEERPGLPSNKLSIRGYGTLLRTDPVFLGLQKTRLLDPLLYFLGTNEQQGDYRSSGCTACHMPYANDKFKVHSAQYAQYGHDGKSFSADPTIPKDEPGHPIKHNLTNAIPTSQCMVCHMHPGTNMVTPYTGYMWWDNETDGEHMYPEKSFKLSEEEKENIRRRNPEGSAMKGKWGVDPQFLNTLADDVNPKLKHTQFADYHGHGWVFRAIFKQDHKGNLLDQDGNIVKDVNGEVLQKATAPYSPEEEKAGKLMRPGVPVHLKDIHLERGMHCVDCHFTQDAHGNGKLYGEPRAAVEISCQDCHGSIYQRALAAGKDTVTTSFAGGNKLSKYKVWVKGKSKKQPILEVVNGKVIQHSALDPEKSWEIVQTMDTIDPTSTHYNEKSRLAKTMHKDGKTWGVPPKDSTELAHQDNRMTCYACHSSWITSCFGCHLPMIANQNRVMAHNEGKPQTRNWTQYNFQVLRDDVYMLGVGGTATGAKESGRESGGLIAPVRSSSAVIVSSQNALRQQIYSQQQTISSEGYSGQAMNTHVPHTVRGKGETKQCTDCHLSKNGDNNAQIAQLLLLGTNFVNFMGRYIYVANGEHGFEAVAATERDEPQAVIGSHLHKLAYPEKYQQHLNNKRILKESYEHHGNVLSLQMRGEYLYAAEGEEGVVVYDIANIDNKDFSERMTTAPVSPLGQKFYVKTKYATAICSPTTLGVDPTRERLPENEEQPISLIYAFLYASDREEGLVVIGDSKAGVATLLDGDPTNNFLKRQPGFNPDGILTGAENLTMAGNYLYIVCPKGLVIVNVANPLEPKVTAVIEGFKNPKSVAIQLRYAFVTDEEGLKVVDITRPERAKLVPNALVPLKHAHNVYVARTYAYVADGEDGLAIIDVERPEKPVLDQMYNADGAINDAHDVKIGMTNASVFAYIADGHNGLRVVQLMSPETTPGLYGFSPRPSGMELVATYPMHDALAISKGLDRDRGVDESGNQLVVFGRRGARPFNLEEQRTMLTPRVTNDPPRKPIEPQPKSAQKPANPETERNNQILSAMAVIGLVIVPFSVRRFRRRRS
ncbi:MAG: hypothetical protein K1Y36_08330 [Blastocatellia bacterium]|nr:hypothetical protein [Blastocatellia bacterium]